jgi:DNA/RNA endonuclease YhcR with UshA esterase domain
MADPAKYKSISVPKKDWEDLSVLATKTDRTRSKMIGRLIRFFKDNKGAKANGKENKSS